MNTEKLDELHKYSVKIRRKLHEYPEIGFDLDRTVGLVSKELENMGIPYTHKYGKGSVVAEIGNTGKIVALRADMDGLPVEEKSNLPYSSKIPGQMHACGHDSHTAILLAVAKYLKENEKSFPGRVRLIFQPSEEGAVSGAKMMVDNGVCDGVDHIICTHCENTLETGKIGIHYGDYMAACIPATIRFLGKTSHATLPEFGIDANAMAVEAYQKMRDMVKEEADQIPYIWSVGKIKGGHVHNVISDLCEMDISFRFFDMDFADRVGKRVKEICTDIAKKYGGNVEIIWNMSTGPVRNDEKILNDFVKIVKSVNLEVEEVPRKMSSEDFGWYLTKVPGMLFRFGTENKRCGKLTVAHNNDFVIDEDGMKSAILAFCSYILDISNFKY
ncbi:MAG TPA: amidohydrolase [Clostridiaceae bacterium]|nr:amidohydrolase [Clostridiaceae bacterium]